MDVIKSVFFSYKSNFVCEKQKKLLLNVYMIHYLYHFLVINTVYNELNIIAWWAVFSRQLRNIFSFLINIDKYK